MKISKFLKEFLPSRFVVAFIIIPTISLILFFYFKNTVLNFTNKEEIAKNNFIKKLDIEVRYKDTDNDGLKDWEERLYETEVKNPDSDGDGIFDGLEIKNGTDPLDPFNRQKKENKGEKIEKKDGDYRKNPNLTQTDILARDFFIKTVSLKESGFISNNNAKNQIIDELLKQNNFVFENKYKKENLNILKYIQDIKVKKKIKEGVLKYKINQLRDNYYLFSMYMDSSNENYLKELQDNIKLTDNFLEFLIKINVNKEISLVYLEYLNILNKYNEASKKLFNIDQDPVGAWSAFNQYLELEERLDYVTKALGLYFSQKNI